MRLSTTCDVVAFCSSAGHCQLDCEYCVVHPVIKRMPSLTYEDLRFFLDEVGGRAYLMFSGKGDFFAGYAKRDRFLDRLLDHDVEVALDVNGVLLNEYPELPAAKLEKVRAINLTMHYKQLREKKVRELWVEHARTILDRHAGELLLGTILSPRLKDSWEESLAFYEEKIFGPTGRRIWLIEDAEQAYDAEERRTYEALATRYAHLVEKTFRNDFEAPFAGKESVVCPAGADYFRIWNDGRVDGCPYRAERGEVGNLKERRFRRHETFFRCDTPRYCDCYDIAALGKMRDESEATEGALPVHPAVPGARA